MRTSYIASPLTKRPNTPHKYYTRNNLTPVRSPNSPQYPGQRENTPPTFLEGRPNLFTNQGHPAPSDEDEPCDVQTAPSRATKTRPVYKLLRNSLLWIGLTFLTINVYILSICKKLWAWKHPFHSTGYNTDVNYSNSNYYETPPNRPPLASRLRTLISNSLPERTRVPSSEETSEVGWFCFMTSLVFFAGLFLIILGIILVPHPVSNDSESRDVFVYLEDQKLVTAQVSKLESNLMLLDQQTSNSHEEIQSALKNLENKRKKLESELVVIATSDRQQPSNIKELQKQNLEHTDRFEDVSDELNGVRSKQDHLMNQLETLKQSISTVSELQAKLSQNTQSLTLTTTTLTQSTQEQLEKLQVSQEASKTSESKTREELNKSHDELVKSRDQLEEELRGLIGRQDKIEKNQENLTKMVQTRNDKDIQIEKEKLLDTTAALTSEDIQKLREDMLAVINNNVGETKVRLEKQAASIISHQDKISSLESAVSRRSAQDTVPDMLPRIDALSRDVQKIKDDGVIEELKTDVQKLRYKLDGHAEDVSRIMTLNEKAASDLRLQSIESKLALMAALQAKLDAIESTQLMTDKRLETDISEILAKMKDLEKEQQEKIASLNLAFASLQSDGNAFDVQIAAEIKQQADEIKTIKDLLESDITSETKIKRIVLEVLASATHHSQDTRFFSDWLRANFLTREDVDESVSIADKRDVKNETLILPSQDQIIQVIINELQSKHSINIKPGSGITVADIRYIVSEALQIFDEDKTGQADYALEALGGSVITVGCTETYYEGAPYASFMTVPLFRVPNPPTVALQSDITPGKCWAFKGSKGYMMLKLARAVQVERFSMEHLPRRLSLNNDVSSAPQKFQVQGLSHPHDKSSHHFGDYRYSDTGTALQYFNVKHSSVVAFEIVELEIESNHGNTEYTCLYRIRVHGKIPKLV